MNKVGRNTGESAAAIHKIFKKAVSGSHNHCGKATGDNTFDNDVIHFAEQFMINKVAYNSDNCFDKKRDWHINHVSGQQVCQRGTETGSQTAVDRSEKNTGQNNDRISSLKKNNNTR